MEVSKYDLYNQRQAEKKIRQQIITELSDKMRDAIDLLRVIPTDSSLECSQERKTVREKINFYKDMIKDETRIINEIESFPNGDADDQIQKVLNIIE